MNSETVRHSVLAALGALSLTATSVEATVIYMPCWDDVASGKAVLIPYKKQDYQSYTPMDCIFVTATGRFFVYRPGVPEKRNVYVVQEFRPDGRFSELPASRWWNEKVTVEPLPSPVVPEGMAAGDDGAVVYVASAAPRSVLLFDRDKETGLLSFRELRELGSQAEREEFLRKKRLEWTGRGEELRRKQRGAKGDGVVFQTLK
jgi:hypothetical protein